MKTYKLLRLRKNGTLGPLFINRKLVMPLGEVLKAEFISTKGYAPRPGWHSTPEINAPHLSLKDRVWVECEINGFHYTPEHQPHLFSPRCDMRCQLPESGYYYWERPASQGGRWIVSDNIKLIRIVSQEEIAA